MAKSKPVPDEKSEQVKNQELSKQVALLKQRCETMEFLAVELGTVCAQEWGELQISTRYDDLLEYILEQGTPSPSDVEARATCDVYGRIQARLLRVRLGLPEED